MTRNLNRFLAFELSVKYHINWHIRPPYVARARQMTISRGGLIAKGIYYVHGPYAKPILLGRDSDPSLRVGLIAKGSYMPVNTVPCWGW